jgi:phytoene dehydrogenase-like protein
VRVAVVGAGLAGLACARELLATGIEVAVYEASDGVGGRVRSDGVDGFTLDRGFQVLFTAYPAVQRRLDLNALRLRTFPPGARLAQDGRLHTLSDPLRDPSALLPSLLCPLVTLPDKLRTAALGWELKRELESGEDLTAETYLRSKGFSEAFLESFARPFFGSIFLDRSLQTSARALRFVWRMLVSGETAVPAAGMGALSEQLAAPLKENGCLHLSTRIASLDELSHADAIVVATPAPEAARLTGRPTPTGSLGVTTLYFAGDEPLFLDKKLLLSAETAPLVSHAALLTNVAPEYAPPGRHLLSASVLGIPTQTDDELFRAVKDDLARLLTGEPAALKRLGGYAPLALYRIPYAQFAQPPGVVAGLPDHRTDRPGTFLCGEYTRFSGIDGALASGESCAAAVLKAYAQV